MSDSEVDRVVSEFRNETESDRRETAVVHDVAEENSQAKDSEE
jgi:hypothetical protein